MERLRLDNALVRRGLVASRSQAESYIKLGKVKVDGRVITKTGFRTEPESRIEVDSDQYVSRAALKLAGANQVFNLNFNDKVVLDVGSSTGGFTDYALKNGANKVIAVDVGTDQLHPSLRQDGRVELHEKTDIRQLSRLNEPPEVVLIDVSFISLREILPTVAKLSGPDTEIVAMLKPQFETGAQAEHKGVIKNDTIRRRILKDFETWVKLKFNVMAKADSAVAGAKGNVERFYLLKKVI